LEKIFYITYADLGDLEKDDELVRRQTLDDLLSTLSLIFGAEHVSFIVCTSGVSTVICGSLPRDHARINRDLVAYAECRLASRLSRPDQCSRRHRVGRLLKGIAEGYVSPQMTQRHAA
jgi:hypothetical protein